MGNFDVEGRKQLGEFQTASPVTYIHFTIKE